MKGDPVNNKMQTLHVISHTHWDREWYRTFHDFRGDLTRVVRLVLEALEADGEFRHRSHHERHPRGSCCDGP